MVCILSLLALFLQTFDCNFFVLTRELSHGNLLNNGAVAQFSFMISTTGLSSFLITDIT